MNKYLKNIEKIEFVVTNACTGKCKHCSEGEHQTCAAHIDPGVAADAVKKIASSYPIKTVMTFGGEPLLCVDAVYKIQAAARDMGVEKRQVITNGYFTKETSRVRAVAEALARCGVNDILLSVDAFHQEFIPIERVKLFASELMRCGVPLRTQPAWLVSRDDDNSYNNETRSLLEQFAKMGIAENSGNVIFPEGNALRYLGEYFKGEAPSNPYVEDPSDVRCVSFSADGEVLGDNVYRKDILDILRDYAPLLTKDCFSAKMRLERI